MPLTSNSERIGLLQLRPRRNGVDYRPKEREVLEQAAEVGWGVLLGAAKNKENASRKAMLGDTRCGYIT